METGVSYFSSRTLRHASDDLQEMVDQGCTYVVHCFTETDLAYYRDTMRDIIAATHGAGLEAWLDPWGLAGIFSGETFTRFPLDRPETWQVLSHPPADAGLPPRVDRSLRRDRRRRPVLGRTALLRRPVARRPLRRLGLPLRRLPLAVPRAARQRHALRLHARGPRLPRVVPPGATEGSLPPRPREGAAQRPLP